MVEGNLYKLIDPFSMFYLVNSEGKHVPIPNGTMFIFLKIIKEHYWEIHVLIGDKMGYFAVGNKFAFDTYFEEVKSESEAQP